MAMNVLISRIYPYSSQTTLSNSNPISINFSLFNAACVHVIARTLAYLH